MGWVGRDSLKSLLNECCCGVAQPLDRTTTAALINSNPSVQRSRLVFFIKCVPFEFGPIRSGFRAESTHNIDGNADQQNQANFAAAEEGTTKVKSAAAKQKKKDQ